MRRERNAAAGPFEIPAGCLMHRADVPGAEKVTVSDAPEVQLISRNPGSDKGAAAMAVKLLIDLPGACKDQLRYSFCLRLRKWEMV